MSTHSCFPTFFLNDLNSMTLDDCFTGPTIHCAVCFSSEKTLYTRKDSFEFFCDDHISFEISSDASVEEINVCKCAMCNTELQLTQLFFQKGDNVADRKLYCEHHMILLQHCLEIKSSRILHEKSHNSNHSVADVLIIIQQELRNYYLIPKPIYFTEMYSIDLESILFEKTVLVPTEQEQESLKELLYQNV